jgi:dienelactone hydrolase
VSGVGTLLFDLLTPGEEAEDEFSARLRFDIAQLASRLLAATEWVSQHSGGQAWRIGYFGASTGGAAALVAAARAGGGVHAVVSRGGRPDLAGDALAKVVAPTLLIVGEHDDLVLELNQEAFSQLQCPKQLVTVPRATHLFEETGALDHVARLAADWFDRHLKAP